MFKVRNLRPELSVSLMKSTDHTWLGGHSCRQRLAHRSAFSPTLAPQRQLLLHVQPVHPALAGHPKWEKSHFQWTISWGAGQFGHGLEQQT